MKFGVVLEGMVTVRSSDGEVVLDTEDFLTDHLDSVMEELLTLGAEDPSIDLDLTDGNKVSFSVVADGTDPLSALNAAGAQIRTAIHAAGGSTPDWPNKPDQGWGIRLVSANSNELVTA